MAPPLVAMDVSKLGVVDGDGIRRLSIRNVKDCVVIQIIIPLIT